MADANKMTIRADNQQSSSKIEHDDNDDSNEVAGPATMVAAFSVAQALSMVRRRREEQDRIKQEQEKLLEEQRREKAKEKRQRRRRNQKEKRVKLKEEAAKSSAKPNGTDELGQAEKGSAINEATESHAVGTKRSHDHEIGDDGQVNVTSDEEINLKRLPVKKRLRLESSKTFPLTTTATPSTTSTAAGLHTTKTLDGSTKTQVGSTAIKKVTSLVPRALLLKQPKR